MPNYTPYTPPKPKRLIPGAHPLANLRMGGQSVCMGDALVFPHPQGGAVIGVLTGRVRPTNHPTGHAGGGQEVEVGVGDVNLYVPDTLDVLLIACEQLNEAEAQTIGTLIDTAAGHWPTMPAAVNAICAALDTKPKVI